MRKFVEPEMKVMAVNMKENIAASGTPIELTNGKSGKIIASYGVRNTGSIIDTEWTRETVQIQKGDNPEKFQLRYRGVAACREF